MKRSGLRADPEKVREFHDRGRGKLERRTELKRGRGFRRASAREGPLSPAQWRQAVHDASGGRCVITGAQARDADDRNFDPHHPLAKRVLRDRGLFDRVWDPRNGVWLSARAHKRHETAFKRVPRESLPGSVWEFCAELDALEGSRWASELVLRAHPSRCEPGVFDVQEVSDGEGRGNRDRPGRE